MTTIKGKPGKDGQVRRYFNCTGKSQRVCHGPKVTIYAEDLENMVYQCIAEKLAGLKEARYSSHKGGGERNDLKLRSRPWRQQKATVGYDAGWGLQRGSIDHRQQKGQPAQAGPSGSL